MASSVRQTGSAANQGGAAWLGRLAYLADEPNNDYIRLMM
jgi:hypothetical protein